MSEQCVTFTHHPGPGAPDMYAVLVTDKQLGGTVAYGPYQQQWKANVLVALLTNPVAADFHDPEKHDVNVTLLRKYEELF